MGGLARELRTLMEGLVLAPVLAPRGWAVKARYEAPLCAKSTSYSTALHLKAPAKYPDLTHKKFL